MDYIGVDIGKTLNVACRLGSPSVFLEFKNNSRGISQFQKWLHKYEAPRILVEATGGYQNLLIWKLQGAHDDVRLINPILARRKKIVSLRKLKTDQHDAEVLAELARDEKGSSWIANTEQFKHRLLAKMYDKVSHRLTEETVRLKRLRELWKETRSPYPEWLDENLLSSLKNLKKRLIKELEAVQDPLIHRLSSVPGISRRGASTIVAEVGSFERFNRIGQFIAYVGLDPAVRQSGGKPQRYGRISKRGSSLLRTTFFHAAMTTWRKQFRELYEFQREKKRTYIETLTIISRKIARIVYSIGRSHDALFIDN